jgi:hypothetical protein
MSPMLRRILLSSLAALLLAGPAAAGTIVVKLTFVPGKLVVRSAPATATAAGAVEVPITIADGRGSGQGWTLKLASGRPVRITSITARCAANSTCTLPRATQAASGAVVLRAARDSGMGVMNLVVTVAPLPAGSQPAALAFTAS